MILDPVAAPGALSCSQIQAAGKRGSCEVAGLVPASARPVNTNPSPRTPRIRQALRLTANRPLSAILSHWEGVNAVQDRT
jgi:hypothetical protein